MGILIFHFTRRVFAFLVILLFSQLICQRAYANVLSNVKSKFPNCEITQESIFPENTQLVEIKKKNEVKAKSQFFNYFKKKCKEDEALVFVHSDLIRTQLQFVLFEVGQGKIRDIEIVKFLEPSEYKVGEYWLEKFKGMVFGVSEIDAVSGATLTSQSINYLAWLSLYLDGIINKHAKK